MTKAEQITEEDLLWSAYREDRSDGNRNHLAMFYDGWVQGRVRAHLRTLPESADTDALLQECRIAVLEAIGIFDVTRRTSFRTYSGRWINSVVVDQLRDLQGSSSRHELRCEKTRLEHEAEGRDPASEMSDEDYSKSFPRSVVSLNSPVETANGEHASCLGDSLVADDSGTPEIESDDEFRHLCRSLSLREQTAFFLRHYCSCSHQEVADALRVSSRHAKRIYAKALTRIRTDHANDPRMPKPNISQGKESR